MKKKIGILVSVMFVLLLLSVRMWSLPPVHFAFTTDILEIIDEDYQIEVMYYTSWKSAFSVRLGYYRTIENPPNEEGLEVYADGDRHWELGGRWRLFLLDRAPNMLFVGAGFDNRPQDNTITPLGEVGFNLVFKPIILSVVGFGGYEIYVYESDNNRFVTGIELRAGVGF
ncbi:MAG: hypothetical protein GF421_00870 [Candidatus Aminicenantes bacterium]|nr:hypothetical protein [Candidatus Aminicenantes bacterium]